MVTSLRGSIFAPATLGVLAMLASSLVACTSETSESDGDSAADLSGTCVDVATAFVDVAAASAAGEFVLTLPSTSASATSWGTKGNEALIFDVYKNDDFLSHIILHQGNTQFSYSITTGALAAGDVLRARVSSLSAASATHRATICGAKLSAASTFGALENGITNAPIYVRPVEKRFDDVPLLVGYSEKGKQFTTVLTNENGGTTEICGGGAKGLAKENLFWGRGADIETDYFVSTGAFERCTGSGEKSMLRYENAHPFLYHGDGHNRMFESRAGYGATCGTSSPDMPDGHFAGWGVKNPDTADDLHYSIILRPVPVDGDATAYSVGGAPRERLIAAYAPWLLRLTGLETVKEGKVDNKQTFTFDRYLHADVYVGDVGGSNARSCLPFGVDLGESGGFVLRAHTKEGKTLSTGQITQDVCGTGNEWKHVAIPLSDGVHSAADFDDLIFDAYDGDGIYLYAIGDAYVLSANGSNGATIDSVRHGATPLNVYVDDNSSGCTDGKNSHDGAEFPCAGSFYEFKP